MYNKTVSIEGKTAQRIDVLIKNRQFRSFSDFMREAAEEKLKQLE
jgi:Arc/MetJ-type ribon-helix-helix transcriptional regulator